MAIRWPRVRGFLFALPILLATGSTAAGGERSTDATYYNDAALPAADPFVLRDPRSGDYFAYSTEGADPGHHFAIYRSPDLATWHRLPGGALDMADGTQWGRDWFWAPEVYHNPETGRYFLFYSALLRDGVEENFGHADFEEPSKIGVAVADSPAGPFRNIAPEPLDYRPYDPDYHDVNVLMDAEQKKPPATLEEGRTAPLGVYLPSIDPNVFFDDGRIYLYFSRNAYRNWVWDHELGKYIEESNVSAVELDADWWHDPSGTTMPRITPDYRDANGSPADPPGIRKDGFAPILDYGSDPQDWENAHVNDYAESGGEKKDRRWAEGSTVLKTRTRDGRPRYFLTYSANNYQNRFYGVGYAVADSPLGPWRKSPDNPVLQEDPGAGMYSTGHGSVIASPDSSQLYYVHHGRPATDTHRRLYTQRMRVAPDASSLLIDGSTADRPIPSGVAPFWLRTDRPLVEMRDGRGRVGWRVDTSSGSAMPLSNVLNRVRAEVGPGSGVTVAPSANGAELTGSPHGVAALSLQYQRKQAGGQYVDVHDDEGTVAVTLPVADCTSHVRGRSDELLITGVTCLDGAEVRGPVRLAPGASLVAVNSVIDGPVIAQDSGAVWLSASTINGSVRVRGARGPVRVDGSEVRGALSLTGNARPVVAGAEVHGPLSCRGNAPAPVNEGRPNTVRGAATGQCADL